MRGGKRMLAQFDKNGDGRITRDEFPAGEEKFKEMDKNGDGQISEDELPRGGNSNVLPHRTWTQRADHCTEARGRHQSGSAELRQTGSFLRGGRGNEHQQAGCCADADSPLRAAAGALPPTARHGHGEGRNAGPQDDDGRVASLQAERQRTAF